MGNKVEPKICPECKKVCGYFTGNICHNCYRKYHWKQKLIACKRCGRMRPNQAKGYCSGCYNSLFHIESVKANNYSKRYNVTYEKYNELTSKCIICGFDKIVSLHHLDKSHENNSENNLVGLCPNCHAMIHHRDYQNEIIEILRQKGYNVHPLIKIMPIEQPKETIAPTINSYITLIQLNSRNELPCPIGGQEGN